MFVRPGPCGHTAPARWRERRSWRAIDCSSRSSGPRDSRLAVALGIGSCLGSRDPVSLEILGGHDWPRE